MYGWFNVPLSAIALATADTLNLIFGVGAGVFEYNGKRKK